MREIEIDRVFMGVVLRELRGRRGRDVDSSRLTNPSRFCLVFGAPTRSFCREVSLGNPEALNYK